MRIILKIAYSTVVWIFFVIDATALMIIALLLFVITYPFDPKRKALHVFSRFWGLHYFRINPLWKVKHKCDATTDKNQPYVIVSNHQSMFDICIMYKIRLDFKWVSKIEVFKMPFVGWLLKMHGDILVNRGDRSSAKNMLNQARSWIDKGCSITVFPEGTRSGTGRVNRFKEGAFMIAKLNKLPVLPVVIEGTGDMLPPRGAIFGGKATAKIHVLPVIPAETVSNMKTKDLSDLLYNVISEEHKRMAPHKYK